MKFGGSFFVVVFLWWCFCGGALAVSVFCCRCFCGGVFVVGVFCCRCFPKAQRKGSSKERVNS